MYSTAVTASLSFSTSSTWLVESLRSMMFDMIFPHVPLGLYKHNVGYLAFVGRITWI